MLDRWNLTNLLVYAETISIFPFIAGQQTYTLGTGGTFNTPRPSRVERASIQFNTSAIPVEIPLDIVDVQGWQEITVKSTTSTFPLVLYNDNNFPFMNLNFWPVPQGPANVILYNWQTMPLLTSLTELIELPQGYSDALIYNLAVRACQMFDRQPSAQLLEEASQAKSDINDINSKAYTIGYNPLFTQNTGTLSTAFRSRGKVVF